VAKDLIELKCPSCNGPLDIDEANLIGVCSFCGTKVKLKEEKTYKYETNNYNIEKQVVINKGKSFEELKAISISHLANAQYDYLKKDINKLLLEYPDKSATYYFELSYIFNSEMIIKANEKVKDLNDLFNKKSNKSKEFLKHVEDEIIDSRILLNYVIKNKGKIENNFTLYDKYNDHEFDNEMNSLKDEYHEAFKSIETLKKLEEYLEGENEKLIKEKKIKSGIRTAIYFFIVCLIVFIPFLVILCITQYGDFTKNTLIVLLSIIGAGMTFFLGWIVVGVIRVRRLHKRE